jgi:hypothetical protein
MHDMTSTDRLFTTGMWFNACKISILAIKVMNMLTAFAIIEMITLYVHTSLRYLGAQAIGSRSCSSPLGKMSTKCHPPLPNAHRADLLGFAKEPILIFIHPQSIARRHESRYMIGQRIVLLCALRNRSVRYRHIVIGSRPLVDGHARFRLGAYGSEQLERYDKA